MSSTKDQILTTTEDQSMTHRGQSSVTSETVSITRLFSMYLLHI